MFVRTFKVIFMTTNPFVYFSAASKFSSPPSETGLPGRPFRSRFRLPPAPVRTRQRRFWLPAADRRYRPRALRRPPRGRQSRSFQTNLCGERKRGIGNLQNNFTMLKSLRIQRLSYLLNCCNVRFFYLLYFCIHWILRTVLFKITREFTIWCSKLDSFSVTFKWLTSPTSTANLRVVKNVKESTPLLSNWLILRWDL